MDVNDRKYLDLFAGLAKDFCTLVENLDIEKKLNQLMNLHDILAELYSLVHKLPQPVDLESIELNDRVFPDNNAIDKIFETLEDIFAERDEFFELVDPFDPEKGYQDLSFAEELSEIYLSLKSGLNGAAEDPDIDDEKLIMLWNLRATHLFTSNVLNLLKPLKSIIDDILYQQMPEEDKKMMEELIAQYAEDEEWEEDDEEWEEDDEEWEEEEEYEGDGEYEEEEWEEDDEEWEEDDEEWEEDDHLKGANLRLVK